MIDTKLLRLHAQQCATCKDPSCHCHLTLARQVPTLLDELDAARAELERMKASLREVHEKLDIGERNFPDSPCAIFSTLLEIHDLGKDAAQDTQP